MKSLIAFIFVAAPVCLLGQDREQHSIESLIKKLGSEDPKERLAATETLKERTDAVPQLREALGSPDGEIKGRAAMILEYHENRPLRELDYAVKAGHVGRVIEIVANWPNEKSDAVVWRNVRGLARNLNEVHVKNGGSRVKILRFLGDATPNVVKAERITEATKGEPDRRYFFRVRDFDHDLRRREPGTKRENWFDLESDAIVASGSVRFLTSDPQVIFAAGPVELLDGGDGLRHTLIVSLQDVHIHGVLSESLIVAQGSVTIKGRLENSRIFSGKSVVCKRDPVDCIISENDSNPLGFIRWADSPKSK